MNRAVSLVLALPLALAMALGLWACDANPVTPPFEPGAVSAADVWLVDGSDTVQVADLLRAPDGWNYAYTVEGVIDRDGGVLDLGGGSTLVVPPRAVKGPTQFVATVDVGPYFEVDLKAYSLEDGGEVTRFPHDLMLEIGYVADMEAIDELRLVMAYLQDDTAEGRKQKVPGSFANPNSKRVHGELDHFSKFAIGIN